MFELIKLVETFPQDCIKFKKVNRKNYNLKVAHRAARFALKNDDVFNDECYWLTQSQIKNDFNLITNYKDINEIYNILIFVAFKSFVSELFP